MSRQRHSLSDQQVEEIVSNLLRYGVIIATSVVFMGGVLYLIRHGNAAPNYQIFRGESPLFRSLPGVETAVLSGRGRGIIQLGLLLLIATPVVRVAFSLLAFMRQRDITYVIITLIVLTGLLTSLVSG